MKIRVALLAAVALTGLVTACRSTTNSPIETGTDTVDASLPTQLPRTAIPSHYAIEVTPHAEQLTFDGKATIDLKVIKATRELVLNAADLAISQANLTPSGGQAMPAKVALDADKQTATFTFSSEVKPGDYKLDVTYAGKINTQANGLFALDYTNVDGQPARSLFTQFDRAKSMIR